MDFLARVFGHSTGTANVAKERLQLVLAHDRTDISQETLELLKDEIVNVISKHIEIDRDHVEVSMTRTDRSHRLVANIPLSNARKRKL
jgi:cell division topological specificity factor